MSHLSSHYHDGAVVKPGDLFFDGNRRALLVASLDQNSALPGYEHWLPALRSEGHSSGFLYIIREGPVFARETDEDQKLIMRDCRTLEEHDER